MSKKVTILLTTFISVVVFLVVSGLVVRSFYYELQNSLVEKEAQEELVLATRLAQTLETEIKSTEAKLHLVAQLPEIQSPQTQICNAKLQEVADLNSRISNIGRVGIDKKFKCTLNASLLNTDAEKLGSYITDIFSDPNHETVLSRIIKLPTGGFAVAIHVPVFTSSGEFNGTVGGAIYFEDFNTKFLADIDKSKHGYVVLQDDDGTIFYHPQTDLVGTNRRPKTPEEEANASAITKLLMKSSKDGSSGTSRYISSLDNKEKIGAYAAASILPNRRWLVVVTQPIEDVVASSLIVQSQQLFIKLFVLVIATVVIPPIFLTLYLVRSLFIPIEKVGKAATEIGKGNLDITIPINSHDEIGMLGSLFNNMARQLKNSYEDLENRVEAKTKELVTKVRELELNKKAMLNILEDLNDEKQKLKDKEKQLVDAQKIGKVGSFTLDLKSNELTFSEELYRIFELDLATKPNFALLMSRVHPDDVVKVQEGIKQAALSTEPIQIDYRIIINNETKWVRAQASGTTDATENQFKLIGTIRDITREHEVDRMKTEFISLASHQLRTPLSAMKWFLEMLLTGDAGELTPEQKEMVTNVDQSNERMIDLVNSLLNISRIESGRIIIDPQPTDMGELVESVVKELTVKFEEKKQKPIMSIHQNLDKINIDPKLIRQVYQNLLTNAIKYSPAGGEISIFVSTKNGEIISQVSDSGMGIPAKDHDKVFQKFYRGENVVKTETEGNGLGLYLVKSIIESSGGKIWFESTEGKGTSFWFSLPLTGSIAKKGEVSLT